MPKKTIRDLDLSGKRLLVRVDFNVPLGEDGSVSNDRRIRAALPTIRHSLEQGASMVLMTHLGRPKGEPKPGLTLDRVADRLGQLLDGTSVRKCDEVVGDRARQMSGELKAGEVLLLENLRFQAGEKANDQEFARRLRELGDAYVNDAFATCHREHASMHAVPLQFPEGSRVIGFLVENETKTLDDLLESPRTPLVAIMGGAKVSDKIGVIGTLLDRADQILIGGLMAYTLMKARGLGVGSSRVAEGELEQAKGLLDRAGDKLVLPVDHLVANRPEVGADIRTDEREITEGWYGMDIGPKAIDRVREAITGAGTVLWNGPMGKVEEKPFREGTHAIVRAMADADATTIVGGGESGEAVEALGLVDQLDHVSTGGGAFLEYIETRSLPALDVIDEK